MCAGFFAGRSCPCAGGGVSLCADTGFFVLLSYRRRGGAGVRAGGWQEALQPAGILVFLSYFLVAEVAGADVRVYGWQEALHFAGILVFFVLLSFFQKKVRKGGFFPADGVRRPMALIFLSSCLRVFLGIWKEMEAASGFEPLDGSFADCSLSHLGTPPVFSGSWPLVFAGQASLQAGCPRGLFPRGQLTL